jgi:hypothetical protein
VFKLPYAFALALFLLATRNVHAFIDSPYLTPQHPIAGEGVFVNIRAGICDGIGSIPGYPQIIRSGNDVRIIVWSDSFTDPILCNFPIGTSTYSVGSYGPGLYSLQVDREYFDDLGETLGETLGMISFAVTSGVEQPVPLPASNLLSLSILGAVLFAVALSRLRRVSRSR